jgi:hypothetical protein
MLTGFWLGNPNDRDHLEDVGIYRRMILKLILKTGRDGVAWTEFIWLRTYE